MQNQPRAAVPNAVGTRAGWYPRWPLLAICLSAIAVGVILVLWNPLICQVGQRQTQPLICGLSGIALLQIFLIWLLFAVLWLAIMLPGIRLVEMPRRDGHPLRPVIEQLTRFDSLRSLIYIQAGVALVLIHVLWWSNTSQPVAFALLSLEVFLAHCDLFARLSPGQQRLQLAAYAVMTLLYFGVQVLFRHDLLPPTTAQAPLLIVEFFLVVIGVAAFILQLRLPRPAAATAQQARNTAVDRLATSAGIVRSIWPISRLWPLHPPQVQPGPDAGGNEQAEQDEET